MADILVENGKIKKIAPVLEGKIINDADVIDATGIDVYPGFVDAHCHMGLDGYATGFAGEDYNESGDPVTPQLSAVDAVNPQDETFQMAREGGVTCVCTDREAQMSLAEHSAPSRLTESVWMTC